MDVAKETPRDEPMVRFHSRSVHGAARAGQSPRAVRAVTFVGADSPLMLLEPFESFQRDLASILTSKESWEALGWAKEWTAWSRVVFVVRHI